MMADFRAETVVTITVLMLVAMALLLGGILAVVSLV